MLILEELIRYFMSNEELIRYIDKSFVAGVSSVKIRDDLLDAGWKVEDVDEALNTVDKEADTYTENKTFWPHLRQIGDKEYRIAFFVFIIVMLGVQYYVLDPYVPLYSISAFFFNIHAAIIFFDAIFLLPNSILGNIVRFVYVFSLFWFLLTYFGRLKYLGYAKYRLLIIIPIIGSFMVLMMLSSYKRNLTSINYSATGSQNINGNSKNPIQNSVAVDTDNKRKFKRTLSIVLTLFVVFFILPVLFLVLLFWIAAGMSGG